MATQVQNGKAFEYALATTYLNELSTVRGLKVNLIENAPLIVAKRCYDIVGSPAQTLFNIAARKTVDTLCILEPGLVTPTSAADVLTIRLASDADGQAGDVRDVIFSRSNPTWEMGISAKNNHDDVKHSRLSPTIDFGQDWLGINCSPQYFYAVNTVFTNLRQALQHLLQPMWSDLGDKKAQLGYLPILAAFEAELHLLNQNNPGVPGKLLSYLIGKYPFYKVIKNDANNCVEVKAFNINGGLNKPRFRNNPTHRVDSFKLPTQIISIEKKPQTETTLIMVLDEGWQISFRIHNASSKFEASLKFAVSLIGNPPILFTQHLFL